MLQQDLAAQRARYERLAGRMPISEVTVNRLVELFMDHARGYYVQRAGRSSEVTNFREATSALWLYSDLPASDFGPIHLRACREWMIEQGWARSTINARTRRIRQVWRWGVERELVPPDTLDALKAVTGLRKGRSAARETRPVRMVQVPIIEATLPHLPPVAADMVRIALLTGARPGELVGMDGRHIDRSGAVWILTPMDHKTAHLDKERHIFIGPQAQRIIEPYLKPGPLFLTRLKKPYTVHGFEVVIRRACAKAGISPAWSPNQLRHTAATIIRREFGIEVARAVLGHAKVETTAIYAEADEQAAQSAMLRLG